MIIGGAGIACIPLYFWPSPNSPESNPENKPVEVAYTPLHGADIPMNMCNNPCVLPPQELPSSMTQSTAASPHTPDQFDAANKLETVKTFSQRFPYTFVYNEEFHDAQNLQRANITDSAVRYRLTFTYMHTNYDETQFSQTRNLVVILDAQYKVIKSEFVCINEGRQHPAETIVLPATLDNVDRACPLVKLQ